MDKPKTPETLESETPEEASGTNQNGSGLASVSGISDVLVAENEEVETREAVEDERPVDDVGEVEDSARFEGEKSCGNVAEIEKEGCLVSDSWVDERERVAKLDSTGSVENEAELGLLESKSVENEDAEVEKMGEENSLESNGIAASEGISLYVDISGSPSGFVEEEDGGEEQGRSVDGRELSFVVGDIVWVQTKNQSWWPGKICDPVDAPKNAVKSGEGADLLVWYYCISNFVWCFPFQLRPFHESFEEMSGKNRARLFLVAVDKALDEFGRCVKLEMTCSCDSKCNQQSAGKASSDGGVLNSERTSGRLGGFSVTNFEPLPFVEHLKYLAQVVSKPRPLDFTVTQNRLSAFYSSIGHRQLPTHLLAEKDETEEVMLSQPRDQVEGDSAVQGKSRKNDSEEGFVSSGSRKRKSKKASEIKVEDTGDVAIINFRRKDKVMEKGSDLRERKKSRYLSYPYINLERKGVAKENDAKGHKDTSEASAGVSQDTVSPVNSKSNGEKFWKKWYKIFSGEIHMPDGSEMRTAASTKMLRQLLTAAVDGLHPNQNSGFTSVSWFFSRFRISAYHEESVDETCPKKMTSQNVGNDSEPSVTEKNEPEIKPKRKGKKKNENSMEHLQGEISLSSPNVVSSDVPAAGEDSKGKLDPSLGKDLPTAVKKPGQTDSERLKTKPLSGLSDVNISVAGVGVSVKDALETGQPMPCTSKAKKMKKKKREGSISEHIQTEQTTDIPDLNRSNSVPSVNDSQVVNHVASEGTPDGPMNPDANAVNVSSGLSDACGTNAKPSNLVVDLGVPQVGLAGLNYVSHTAVLLDFVGNNVKPGLIEKDGQPFGVFQVEQGKIPTPKKRKRKEKKVATEQHIPDLNGAGGEPTSVVGKEAQETNGVTPPAKPARKKRKKMQFVLNYPRNPSFSGPDTGTALLLTFGPGTAMPSREDLISTFGKFGQLKESETRVSGDTSSAQIAFVKSADASEALKSVERNNHPFGSALVNFRLHQLSAPPKVPETNHVKAPPPPPPLPQPPTATPPLDFIKQNLQMMTSMLEKSGDNLSHEMRTKLENEIKGLLSKVSSMAGSCSLTPKQNL